MTTYSFPNLTPNAVSLDYVANTQSFVSQQSGAQQTIGVGGERLQVSLSFVNLTEAQAAELRGFLIKLNGREHRFVYVHKAYTPQGNFGGTPLVAGAGQAGNTLAVDGCSLSVTDWIKAGDFFSLSGGGNTELKVATEDANSDGSGDITLTFRPRLRASFPDNTAITTTNPGGVFMLQSDTVSWSHTPGFTNCRFSAIEDVA